MARVAVAFNDDVHRKAHLNEIEKIGEAEVAEAAREAAGLLGAELIAVGDDIRASLRALREFDAVVDLCEGVLGKPGLEKNLALALEIIGVAPTSCHTNALGICSDKILVKQLLRAAGLPAPRGYRSPSEAPPGTYIVKPALEDAGIGIDRGAVVSNRGDLEQRCAWVRDHFRQPALIEEFIDGRELNQSAYCGTLLPPGEVIFAAALKPEERVVGWKAKWAIGSAEDLATVNRTPAEIDETTRTEIARICLSAIEFLGIDMAVRFDLRQSSRTGVISIVDINPNPDLGSGSGFRKALDAAGKLFSDLLNTLIIAGCARRKKLTS